jgi:small subunit ribosomal protein S16
VKGSPMAVKMRLRREGKKKQPFYRVVVADVRSPRDGRYIEDIGYYQPTHDPSTISIDRERALHWLRNGVQPSQAVVNLLRIQGIWEEFRPGDPGKDRSAKNAARDAKAAERDARAQAERDAAQQAQRDAAEQAQAEPEPEPVEAEAAEAPSPSEEVVEQARTEDAQPHPGPAEEAGALEADADGKAETS